MHRFIKLRIVRAALPVFLLLVICFVFALQVRSSSQMGLYADYSVYEDFVFGKQLADGVWGLGANTPGLAGANTLWRILLACGAFFGFSVELWVLGLNVLVGVLILLVVVRFCRLLFPFPPYVLCSVFLLVLASGFIPQLFSGSSQPIAALIVSLLLLFHVEGIRGSKQLLSVAQAFLLGILIWFHVEFAALWVVLFVHAFCFKSQIPEGSRDESTGVLLITRFFIGLLLMALFLLPMMVWNVRIADIPWPASVDAPLSFGMNDAFATGVQAWINQIPGFIHAQYADWTDVSFLQHWFFRICFFLGASVLTGVAVWRREERAYTVLVFLLLLLPPVLALFRPVLGAQGAHAVMQAFAPGLICLVAYGFFQLPLVLEKMQVDRKKRLPAPVGVDVVWIAAASLVMVFAVFSAIGQWSKFMHTHKEVQEDRMAVDRFVQAHSLDATPCISDIPGWVAWWYASDVYDLSGHATYQLLPCHAQGGGFDRNCLLQLFSDSMPAGWMWVTQPDWMTLADEMGGRRIDLQLTHTAFLYHFPSRQ